MKISSAQFVSLQERFLALTEECGLQREDDWLEGSGREGIFSTALVVWLMLLQGIEGASMSTTLNHLSDGAASLILKRNERSKRIKEKRISLNTGGYSQAKSRLPLVDVQDITEIINQGLIREKGISSEALYTLDGTTVCLERTAAIVRRFKPHRNNRGKVNNSLMRIVIASGVRSGIVRRSSFGPCSGKESSSEQVLAAKTIEQIEGKALFIGDRNFGVFSVCSHAYRLGHEVLFRLTEPRSKQFIAQADNKSGAIDTVVEWKRSRYDDSFHEENPSTIHGRFIRTTLHRAGFRPLTLCFFTTSKRSVGELVELYGKRVNVETDIRYLKYMFKMERITSKTPAMVEKEILMRLTAYNMMRDIVAQAAQHVGLEPRQVSFSKAAEYTKLYGAKLDQAVDRQERDQLIQRYFTAIRQLRLPQRSRKRNEPRQVVRQTNRYPTMKTSRKEARKALKENSNLLDSR